MSPYKYSVDEAVLQIFISSPKRRRDELLRVFDRLASDPFLPGDFVQLDDAGRSCQVKRFGHGVVTWWAEHLGSRVHIIDADLLR